MGAPESPVRSMNLWGRMAFRGTTSEFDCHRAKLIEPGPGGQEVILTAAAAQ